MEGEHLRCALRCSLAKQLTAWQSTATTSTQKYEHLTGIIMSQEELLERCKALALQPPVDVFQQERLKEFQAVYAEGQYLEDQAMFVGPRTKRCGCSALAWSEQNRPAYTRRADVADVACGALLCSLRSALQRQRHITRCDETWTVTWSATCLWLSSQPGSATPASWHD
jgi:hypothetical protein